MEFGARSAPYLLDPGSFSCTRLSCSSTPRPLCILPAPFAASFASAAEAMPTMRAVASAIFISMNMVVSPVMLGLVRCRGDQRRQLSIPSAAQAPKAISEPPLTLLHPRERGANLGADGTHADGTHH